VIAAAWPANASLSAAMARISCASVRVTSNAAVTDTTLARDAAAQRTYTARDDEA